MLNSRDKRGTFLEVEIGPKDNTKRTRWRYFTKWLKRLINTPEAKAVEKRVKDYLEVRYDGEVALKGQPKYINKKIETEIEVALGGIRANKDRNNRENMLFEQEFASIKAEARLKNSQAIKIEYESAIKLHDYLKQQGFEAAFTMADGALKVTVIDKRAVEDAPQAVGKGLTQEHEQKQEQEQEEKQRHTIQDALYWLKQTHPDLTDDELSNLYFKMAEENKSMYVDLDVPAFIRNQQAD